MKAVLFFLTALAVEPSLASGREQKGMYVPPSQPDPKTVGYQDWDTWNFETESASGSKYYLKRIIESPSQVMDFWLKIEKPKLAACNPKLSSGTNNSFLQSPYDRIIRDSSVQACESDRSRAVASSIGHVVFACKTRKAKYLETVEYNEAGEPLRDSEGKDKWMAIYPDTVMESIFTGLCHSKK